MDLQLQAAELDLTISLWPTLLAWIGPLLSMGCALLLALRPARRSPSDALLAFALCAVCAAAGPAVLMVALGTFDQNPDLWIPSLDQGFLLVVADGAATALSFGLVGLGLLFHYGRDGQGHRFGVLAAIPGPLVGLLGVMHGLYLTINGTYPSLETVVPPRVHTGPALAFPVSGAEGWTVSTLSMPRSEPGRRCAEVTGARPGLQVHREWCWEVGEDRGVTWFGLDEGTSWSWVPTTERRDQILWIIPSRQHVEGPPVTVSVHERAEKDGLTLHRVHLETEGRVEDWDLYGWNGEVWRHMPVTEHDTVPPATDTADLIWAWNGPNSSTLSAPGAGSLVDCRAAWFADATCGCTNAPTRDVPVPSALLCHSSPSTTAGTVTSILTTVLTGGLVILDPNAETTWMLRSATRSAP